jgi:hypothetical protein
VIIATTEDFDDERDRFACVLATAVGIGVAAGLDSGEIIRAVHHALDATLEFYGDKLDKARANGEEITCEGAGRYRR